MSTTTRLYIGDVVRVKNRDFIGTVRYFTSNGKQAFIVDAGGRFSKWPVEELIKVKIQEQKAEVKNDGNGL